MERETGTFRVKSGLAEMLKGGVIMDVTNADQAKIAEDAGACAVMALERVPADIRAEGGVARMADATKVEEIMNAVSVPVIASGGAGSTDHVAAALQVAQAALLASILHENPERLVTLRDELGGLGVLLRDAA